MLKGQKKILIISCSLILAISLLGLVSYFRNKQEDIKKTDDTISKKTEKSETKKIDKISDKRYALIPDHKVSWKIFKRTGGTHEGIMEKVTGYIDYSDSQISGGEILFNMNSVTNTDIYDKVLQTRFLKDLKGRDFFAVDTYNSVKLVITSSEKNAGTADEVIAHGQLTIKDITNPIDITLRKNENNGKINVVGSTRFNRALFGILKGSSSFIDTFGSILIDDDVQVSFVLNFE